jgi:signal transduction histidine kinase
MMSLLRSVQTKAQEVNLVSVVRSAELYAKDDLRAAGITLRVESAGRAVKVRGDEGQLLLAVSNLLRNAVEAMRPGDTGRTREIVISVAHGRKAIVLSVSDSGPGLPRETLAKIPLHTTKPQGTGLGLFIVKAVADNHGAKLEARQSALGGAELRLIFPAGK